MNPKYKPMLASPLKKGNIVDYDDWAIEEKYDGHRMLIEVDSLGQVRAFARPRKDGRQIERKLPDHLVKLLRRLPAVLLDGELLGGDTSTDVTRLDLEGSRELVLFDVLEHLGVSVCSLPYDERHAMLEDIVKHKVGAVRVAPSYPAMSERNVARFVSNIWRANGEGAILKLRASIYHAGRRTTDWLKLKRLEHADLPIIGFEATRGEVLDRGPFAIVLLQGSTADKSKWPSCKTRNDEELDALETAWRQAYPKLGKPTPELVKAHPHPWVKTGRRLVIEFGGRTRDGGYRGPVIWDRWEDE